MISKIELKQYERQILIKGWGTEAQEKIKNTTVFIAGAGGLGSSASMYLATAGFGRLIICDYDNVELSNLNRQILHNHKRIGMNKADSALITLRDINPSTDIVLIKEKITKKNAKKLIGNSDIIIDCLDNFQTRHILNKISVEFEIPMIHAGITEFHGQITFLNPPETPCLACFYSENPKKEIFPITGATAGIFGSLQAMEAIKYITGIGENLKNKILFFDGKEMRFSTINISHNLKCKICKERRA